MKRYWRTSNPLRVWISADYLWCGGSERWTTVLANAFAERGDDVAVHCSLGVEGQFVGDLDERVELLGKPNMADSVAQALSLLPDARPDLYIVNNSIPGLLAAQMVRYAVGHVGVLVHSASTWYATFIEQQRQVDCFFAVSQDIQRWLVEENGVDEDKVILLENLIDTEAFQPPSRKQQAAARYSRLAKIMPVDDGNFVFGYVGRISHEKGPHLIVKAFKEVHNQYPHARLVLVGGLDKRAVAGETVQTYKDWTSEEIDLLRTAIAEVDPKGTCIHWTGGAVDDVTPWYHLMDTLVFASKFEGLPLAALEAMASGVPIIIPDVGSCGLLVRKPNGFSHSSGVLYQAGQSNELPDQVDLTDAMLDMVESEYLHRGLAARVLVQQEYSQQEFMGDYLETLTQGLLSRNAFEGEVKKNLQSKVCIQHDGEPESTAIARAVADHLFNEHDVTVTTGGEVGAADVVCRIQMKGDDNAT